MILTISRDRLLHLVLTQLENNFLLDEEEGKLVEGSLNLALARVENCFKHSTSEYYQRDGEIFFNPYQSGQYCIFLYFLNDTILRKGLPAFLCDKIYFLNKMLNGIDLFYRVQMPEVFYLDHPVGTVMGRAKYGNHFCFHQNCTVGNNKGIYPEIGENVTMHSHTAIIGKCKIGDNVAIASGAFIKDQDVPSYSLVFGSSPNLIIKARDPEYFQRR